MNKIFTCQLCNRQFNRKYNLNQHLKRKNPCVKKKTKKFAQFHHTKIYQNIPTPYQNIPKYTKIYQNRGKQRFNLHL